MIARVVLAVAAGVAVGLGFAPVGWWPLAVLGVGLLTLVAWRRTIRSAILVGYAFGLGLFGSTVWWVEVLGWFVAVLLVGFMALWGIVLGFGLSRVTRLRGWPIWAAAVWAAVEFAEMNVPLGGFCWSRLAYLTVDSPLAGWLPWVGAGGTSVLVALVGNLLAAAARHGTVSRRTITRALTLLAAAAIVGLGGVLARRPLPTPTGTVAVGIVQGNVDGSRGANAMGYARSVTNNHLAETVVLMASARAGLMPVPDFVIWPENSTDIDPAKDNRTKLGLQAAVKLIGAPLLFGAVTDGPGADERQTVSIWWGTDLTQQAMYTKRNLVPFGEWVPLRPLLLSMFPILKETGPQSIAGTGNGLMNVSLSGGRRLRLGDVICFELAYDSTLHDTLVRNPEMLAVQSNSATYMGTWQPAQQFAITRVRAIEARKDAVVATTNGVSGLIRADGTIASESPQRQAAAESVTVDLRSGVTPGVRFGQPIQRTVALFGLLAVSVSLAPLGKRRGLIG